MTLDSSRIVLGTAQFGGKYGVANQRGALSSSDISEILGAAQIRGVTTLDTAIDYGNCQSVLGAFNMNQWKVITKLPEFYGSKSDCSEWVEEQISNSLEALNVSSFYGVLLHRPLQLLSDVGDRLISSLSNLKNQNLIEKIGVSVYSPTELEKIWPVMQFDLVQAPLNIFDRRLIESGWLDTLKREGVEVHARSIFLQGLLLMGAHERPRYFDRWNDLWLEWERYVSESGNTALELCLNFVLSIKKIDRLVVGFESAEQLLKVLSISDSSKPDFVGSKLLSEDIIDPRNWVY